MEPSKISLAMNLEVKMLGRIKYDYDVPFFQLRKKYQKVFKNEPTYL